jgi:hypothetical protein
MDPHPYRQAYEARDLDRLVSLLSDDVSFHSAIVTEQAFEGRDSVAAFIAIVLDFFEDNQFTHEFGDKRSHVLVANARVLDKPVKTTTLLEFDAEGKIREIWVMARPLTGVVAIAEAIGSQLATRRGPGGGPALRALLKPLVGLAAVANWTGSRLIAALNRSTA